METKQLFTSYYAKSAKNPNAISISAWTPRWFAAIPKYLKLAPSMEIVKLYKAGEIDDDEYTKLFFTLLLKERKLSAQQVVDELPDGAVLLCFEKPSDFCHRRLVAEWIEVETGLVVPELKFEKSS